MHLKELEIQGFKSFPDKTRITIGEGITGVVGPNGSGKSNISDSIRWVLGETSSKQLRGAGKMEDVIFGGTQTRGAMGYAAVSLTIDNSDHGLEMDADEVTIGRRYYRSGESEYTINGQSVRLKDVYELLLDTGLGRDGYAIVGQGRIAEIVGAKSTERREIFEEASGIAKYRYRKMKPNAAWPRGGQSGTPAGYSGGAGKAGWTPETRQRKGGAVPGIFRDPQGAGNYPVGGFNPPRTGYGAGPAAQV